MSDPSKRSAPFQPGWHGDEATRLNQIRRLWSQLARLRSNSAEHQNLVREIRRETDAFRKLTDKDSREK
jgi:hypothetical protein